jgi:phosphoribosylformylglycinamidine synthase
MVEVVANPSIFFSGMAGSRMPIATAHGEGYARFDSPEHRSQAQICLRFVNNRGNVTETYPYNPNGSPEGITGLTTPDGRFTVLMPHPERMFRTLQQSWAPEHDRYATGGEWGEDSPWMRMFRNARAWLG